MLSMRVIPAVIVAAAVLQAFGCGNSSEDNIRKRDIPAADDAYVVFAWNDLGMHCLNPTYDAGRRAAALQHGLGPGGQARQPAPDRHRGAHGGVPRSSTTRTPTGKGSPPAARTFRQFWDNAQALFGAALAHDTGLNLEDPAIHNGLSGSDGRARGITSRSTACRSRRSTTPTSGLPYQVIEVTIKSAGNGRRADAGHRADLGRAQLREDRLPRGSAQRLRTTSCQA